MNFDEITKNIQDKLGEENTSLIADDIASLITFNSEREKTLSDKNSEIEKLKKDKETLISANGSLLQKISQASEEELKPKKEKEEIKKPFNFKNAFDEKGNFKRNC